MSFGEPLAFAGSNHESRLDRRAELRKDRGALAELLRDEAQVLPIWRGKPLLDCETFEPCFLPVDHPVFAVSKEAEVFLGYSKGTACFARDISAWEPEGGVEATGFVDENTEQHPLVVGNFAFLDMRANLTRFSPEVGEILATAKAILEWHRSHRFCAKCGAPSAIVEGGWRRDCGSCGGQHFPRTDPVVIMLITRGNRVLMGRSPGWPETMYSLLAGFVEPGETLEAAVRREVFEEAGIRVGRVGYLATQPWPFPASLMIGCWGEAVSEEITIDPVEIEDARWVSKEEMMAAIAEPDGAMRPARHGSIARYLIDNWLADRPLSGDIAP